MTEPLQLTKHMQALKIEPGQRGVIIIRPRYGMNATTTGRMAAALETWRRTNAPRLRFLMVPHDLDVFAFTGELLEATNQDGNKEDNANADAATQHVDDRQSEGAPACPLAVATESQDT